MAGQLTVDTLRASTGVLATQNGMTGIAKAWVSFQGGQGNTAGTINGSFNVSSITVNGTGDYTVNFTTAMSNANYAPVGTCGYWGTPNGRGSVWSEIASTSSTTTSSVRMLATTGSSFYNVSIYSVAILGI
jgi:hypothetical protein